MHFRGPSLGFMLLALLLVALWIAGGASRASVPGQALSRGAAWSALIAAILFARRPTLDGRRALLAVFAAIALVPITQLIPLPPAIWQALPGRALLAASTPPGEAIPWRPLSLSPGSTLNALFSLVIPLTVFVLLGTIRGGERAWLPYLMIALILASALAGLVQFSGSRFDQPLINYTGDVSGTFANRNHFALFIAIGCLPVPLWASQAKGQLRWRAPIAIGVLLLLILTALASGSRTGMLLTAVAVLAALLIARENLVRQLRGRPAWLLPAAVGIIAALVLSAILLGRATSVDRLVTTDIGQDMRVRGLDTVVSMIRTYFPAGTGLGSFDTMFRLHEPFNLLKPTYFNQAHDDYLGIVLDAGVLGLIALGAAIVWWLRSSIIVWQAVPAGMPPATVSSIVLGRLGSAIVTLILGASIVDYPARTPTIMATAMLAACLLAWGATGAGQGDRQNRPPPDSIA